MLHALCVGINDHADGRIPPLRYGCSDAEGIAKLLERQLGDHCRVSRLVEDRATKAGIARAVTEDLPRCVREQDTVLLYFAVRGCPEVSAEAPDPSLHLVTVDTEYERVFATSINVVSELAEWTRRLPASMVLLVLDASFDGSERGRSVEGPGLRFGLRLRNPARLSLSRLMVGDRCALLTACSEHEAAAEDGSLCRGVLTHGLMNAIEGARNSSMLNSFSLHRDVSATVRTVSKGTQNPVLRQGVLATAPLFRIHEVPSVAPTFHS